MSPIEGSGVTSHYARAIVRAAEAAGTTLPADLLTRLERSTRIPLRWQDELWVAWCTPSSDPLAPLSLGTRIDVGHLDSVGMLLMTCQTLGEALRELTTYAPVIGEGVSFTLRSRGGQGEVELRHRFTVCAAQRVESAMGALLHLARWATSGAFRPDGVWFAHEPLARPADYEAILQTRAHFGAAFTGMRFDRRQLDLPMAQADDSLREHLREHADRTLAGFADQDLPARIQRIVRGHPGWGRDKVAEQLGLSGRHLGRLLWHEGLTFKAVREHTLDELATRYLRSGAAVTHVATELGYSDETAFARAFRRWHGTTPGRYRARIADAGTPDR